MRQSLVSLFAFLKTNWRDILQFLLIVSIIVAVLQLKIARDALNLERSLVPELKYSYQLSLSKADREAAQTVALGLVDEFYSKVFETVQKNPTLSYLEAVDGVVPLSKTIPSRPLSLTVNVTNDSSNRNAVASKVRIYIELDRPISSYEVNSPELYKLVNSGEGDTKLIVELDRLLPNQSTTVTIASEKTLQIGQVDEVKLSQTLPVWGKYLLSWDVAFKHSKFFVEATRLYKKVLDDRSGILSPVNQKLPKLYYLPAKSPEVAVRVTSDEGEAAFVRPSPSSPW